LRGGQGGCGSDRSSQRLSRLIQLLTSAIAPAVRAVNDTSSSRLINVTKMNIIMTVERLRTKIPVLDYYHDQKKFGSWAGYIIWKPVKLN